MFTIPWLVNIPHSLTRSSLGMFTIPWMNNVPTGI